MISLNEIMKKHIDFYEEMIREKNITLQWKGEGIFFVELHPQLTDILASNLISNAVSHNIVNGNIQIFSSQEKFSVRNSGEPPTHSPEEMFSRFKKGNQSSGHLGLGLALVKEIVDSAHLSVQYSFLNGQHVIELRRK
jgi:signal transduction histidine kinase